MITPDWAAQEARLLMEQIRTERFVNRTREAVLCLKAEDKIIAVIQKALDLGLQEGAALPPKPVVRPRRPKPDIKPEVCRSPSEAAKRRGLFF